VGGPARLKPAAPRAAPVAREQHRERLRALTRQSILGAAEAALLRDGLGGLTLDAIAAELGLTKQGLYYHYASKEALLAELALQEWNAAADTEQRLRQAQAAGRADPALNPRRMAFVAHSSAMGLLSMQLMVSPVQDPLRHTERALVDELCRALRAAVVGRG
jgi:AcrR family transcriptional regulator